MKRLIFWTALSLTGIAGCVKSPKMPEIPAPENRPFVLDQSSADQLKSVGCEVVNKAVKCASIEDADLNLRKQKMEKRQTVLQNVIKALNASDDSIKLSADGIISKVLLQSSLTMASTSTTGQIADTVTAIAHEQAFAIVLGIDCVGTFKDGEAEPTALERKFVFGRDESDKWQGLSTAPPSSLSTASQLDKDKQLSWKFKADTRQFVKTDGEFTLNSGAGLGTTMQVSCLKNRASGPDKSLSDRPLESRALLCTMEVASAQANAKGDHPYAKSNLHFTSYSRDKQNETGMNDAFLRDPFDDNSKIRFAYALKIVSDQGLLAFQVFDTQSGTTVATLTTANSVPHLEFQFLDALNNTVKIVCADDEKASK